MTYIEKLREKLALIAEPHEVLHYMNWVVQSRENEKLDPENMEEHGSLENYCESCINNAVESKYKEWTDERNILMGQIYEGQKKGYYTRYGYGKDKKFRFRKINVVPQQIKQMQIKLNKEYRVGTIFAHDGQQLVGYETEGFESCNSCEKMFDTSLLLNDQELEHWEDLKDEDFKNIEAREAYELNAIFYEGGCESHELHSRCLKLADRILTLNEEL